MGGGRGGAVGDISTSSDRSIPTGKLQVLFLCTGNSCRSQMAEGLVNHFLRDRWDARSAGTQPAGYVHPFAVQVMAELGIDISAYVPKSADEFRDVELDLVVTLCDEAAEECPLWLGRTRMRHLGFPDPARVAGDQEARLAAFRRVRDDVRQKVLESLARWDDHLPRQS
jgi:arsenate reductase